MDTKRDDTSHSAPARVRPCRPTTAGTALFVLGSLVIAGGHASAGEEASAALAGQTLTQGGSSTFYELPVAAAGRYGAVLGFSNGGSRPAVVVVEGQRVEVPVGTISATHVMQVSDNALTVTQAALAGDAKLSRVTVQPATAAAPPATPTASRDFTLHPFTPTSIWNLPIGTTAAFEPADSARTSSLRMLGNTWANEGTYSHPVVRANLSDPMATVTDTGDASRSGTYRIPSSAPIAAGTDKHLHVISPDGTTVDEAWAMTRSSPSSYTVGRHETVDLRGTGMGPSNGTRAYGGSAIGGLIRAWEVDPDHPKYTGRIDHALAIALRDDQLLYSGGNSGYSGGYGTAKGYVWPATEQDWDSPWAYKGIIPMGTYVAIPGSVDLSTLGLTPQGLMLAKAYQDYGAYVTDRSGDAILAYVEPSAAGKAFTDKLLGPNWTASDLKRIRAQLRVTSSNTAATPNGAPLGAPRRAPLLP